MRSMSDMVEMGFEIPRIEREKCEQKCIRKCYNNRKDQDHKHDFSTLLLYFELLPVGRNPF